ncbi:hypothetical protein FHS68_003977 [Dyadobacter arcticus]|uniref:WYL domain-containing protein n=1 Tax=Dyadobacter arcticus TaxID=1078754 RepID=A0ABX0UT24_9BACT|nr:hypothetical protein [Dyadobacter arcticus]
MRLHFRISFGGLKSVSYEMDNRYQEGSMITAIEAPLIQLVIIHYIRRIYYCEKVGDENHKLLSYFERELIAPLA